MNLLDDPPTVEAIRDREDWMLAVAAEYDDNVSTSLTPGQEPALYPGGEDYDWHAFTRAHPEHVQIVNDFLDNTLSSRRLQAANVVVPPLSLVGMQRLALRTISSVLWKTR